MRIRSGREEGLPYSLSRWTDVPGDPHKWAWMMDAFKRGVMVAFDPRTAIPARWSLDPEDTLGLVFWTKNGNNLLGEQELLKRYRLKIHMTVTGWEEVEKNVPSLWWGAANMYYLAETFGPENVTWRFSPVPMVPDVVRRFEEIAVSAQRAGLRSVYLSFLQTNDLMPETRTPEERYKTLMQLADVGGSHGIQIRLCNEDKLLASFPNVHPFLDAGVCAPPEDFALDGLAKPPSEGCGCVLMVDPFTINETCSMGCAYCYAADVNLAPKKRNTTKSLPVVP